MNGDYWLIFGAVVELGSAQGRGGWIEWGVDDELFAAWETGFISRFRAFGALPASRSWIWLRHPRTGSWRLVCGLGERVLGLGFGALGAGLRLGVGIWVLDLGLWVRVWIFGFGFGAVWV